MERPNFFQHCTNKLYYNLKNPFYLYKFSSFFALLNQLFPKAFLSPVTTSWKKRKKKTIPTYILLGWH